MPKPTYKIKTHFACGPFLFRSPSGKLYAMPGWVEVPEGTTEDQLIHVKPESLIRTETLKAEVVKVFPSSKGNTEWTVTKQGDVYSCNCPGYQYRNRLCKHIKQVIK
jgi:hypothetical protein